jgi:hypothetical protein
MNDDLPQWLQEIGRRPRPHNTGRPVPPISGSITVQKELDQNAATRLEQDFRVVIESCGPEDEYDLNQRILDAMTANRLSSRQAMNLLSSLFSKFDGGPGLNRIDANGNPVPYHRWGAA